MPKVIQVTVDAELKKMLEQAKVEHPMASWSKLLAWAGKKGFKDSLASERIEVLMPSRSEDEDYEELAV